MGDKPALKQLLESGAQGWTKLERVAYIATPKTDEYWAEKVQEITQLGLETFVKEYRNENDKNDRLGLTLKSNSQPEKLAFVERAARGAEGVAYAERMHLLCTAHERIAHAGLIENEEMSPEHWRIRIDLNSQGLPKPTNPLAVLSPKGYIDSLVAIKRRGG